MKLSLAFVTAGLAAFSAVSAAPATKNHSKINDVEIVNYALTLEYLEAAFYAGALKAFDEADFAAAGYPPYVRQRFEELATQEATHVAVLKGALGKKATKPCKYGFVYGDVQATIGLASILESVGVSAYLGAAPDIKSRDYLTAAASIYGIEARHQAILQEFMGTSGSPVPFETPLGYSLVYTLASQFITSCPKTNAPLPPLEVFPNLGFDGSLEPGNVIRLDFTPQKSKKCRTYFAHFLYNLQDVVVKVSKDGEVKVPSDALGAGYIVVTNSRTLSDKTTVAGPIPFNFPVENATA